MPTIVFEPQVRDLKDKAIELLRERNIDARVFFHPLSDLGHFEVRHATPVSHDISSRAFNLPSYHDIASEDIRRVVNAVAEVSRAWIAAKRVYSPGLTLIARTST